VRTLGLSSSFTSLTSLAALVGAFALPACGTPEIVLSPTGGAGGAQGGGGAGGSQGGGGAGGNLFGAGGMGAGGAGGAVLDPCDGVACDVDQSCQVVEGVGTCVNNTCDMLQCSATESCETGPNGGAVCVDISCSTDLDCPVDEHCNGTICVLDVCVPGTATCAGDDVLVCEPNGSGTVVKFSCGSDAYFTSVCVDDGQGAAACTCEDDWDCPANTTCEVGTCVGTGVAPTCSLPPVPFASALPVNEIQWGGTGQGSPANQAVNAPFPLSSQVSATPLVVNLDDDNGDGLINERDFPEIVFVTYCGVDVSVNGIVRAIHGGGPNKGQDFFATCGGTVWHEGDDISARLPVQQRDRQLDRVARRGRSRRRRRARDRGAQRERGPHHPRQPRQPHHLERHQPVDGLCQPRGRHRQRRSAGLRRAGGGAARVHARARRERGARVRRSFLGLAHERQPGAGPGLVHRQRGRRRAARDRGRHHRLPHAHAAAGRDQDRRLRGGLDASPSASGSSRSRGTGRR
jgi:hypothetical protein